MKMHPADIVQEIKGYSFFKSFSADLLLQVAAMMHNEVFPAGTVVLKEGQTNRNLYFLRSGKLEISLAGEVLASFDTPGEVWGEMSVITSNPASTSVRAVSEVTCYVIKDEDFAHVHPKDKDRFQALLYQIYCMILTERLIKTNEKARLFEILNRELHEAQNALQRGAGGRVLLIEPDKKQQMPLRMALGSTGVHLDIASDAAQAEELLKGTKYDVVVGEDSCVDVLRKVEEQKLSPNVILLTSHDVQGNLGILLPNRFVKNIISRDAEDKNATIRFVLTALGKLLNKDLFGIDKYLTWGVDIQKRVVTHSSQREQLREDMCAYLKKAGVRTSVIDRVNTVAEEMLMNAIYDAPVDSHGKAIFNHVSRKQEVQLETHQQSVFRYATDGVMAAVAVVDPFGALQRDVIIDYLQTCYNGTAGSLNTTKGGAGRGLHQIIENSDLTIFNVKQGVRTEVICLFNLDGQKRMSQPSFHYFFM
jgi:CRP-like cAMP-binding protein